MPAPALSNLQPSVAAITPAIVTAGGTVRVLRTIGVMGAPYAAITPDVRTDEDVSLLILPIRERFTTLHADAPPMESLLLVYRQAWMHFNSPRRKKHNPHLRAQTWALVDVRRCCECWAGKRADATGAWQQHQNIADFRNRLVKLHIGDSPVAVASPAVVAPAAVLIKKSHKKKVVVSDPLDLPPLPSIPSPPLSATAKARLRMESILAKGGTSKVGVA